MTCRLREVIRRRCLERAVPAPAARVYLIVCGRAGTRWEGARMDEFVKALVSDGRSPELPEEHDWFGKLVGSWRLDYLDRNLSSSVEGEWIFARVLEGMGIQDVIILPARDVQTETPHPLTEYGTSLRVYNPGTHAWDVAYAYAGKIFRLRRGVKATWSSSRTLATDGINGCSRPSRTTASIGRTSTCKTTAAGT